MPPKKTAVAVADSPPADAPQAEEKGEKKTDAATVRKLAAHPSTAIMVREAITALDSRKGVSSPAIQNYIKQNYPSVDLVRLKGLVRKALKKGIENGTLVRPANSTGAAGATGRFRRKSKNQRRNPKSQRQNLKMLTQMCRKKKRVKLRERSLPPTRSLKKSSEEPKPAKKSKKNEEDVLSSKVAPAKKPKAAKKATEEPKESEPVKPKGRPKAVKEDKEKLEKEKPAQKGKAKADEAPTKAQGKRGKKPSE
ncbi:hypothetical protein WMY93_012401 [Mugilogobius chulae]|uniref:H15 domain-containing protein n=1 Tax=Mugilogobius chulae TaxID=88201 RepID=A0AAW0P5B9_9GOBI